MFAVIALAISQFFRALTKLFSGFEKGAGAFDNLMGWGEDASGNFADVASIERKVARFKAIAEARNAASAIGLSLDDNLDIQDTPVKSVKAVKSVSA